MKTIVTIGPNWRIRADPLNYVLERRKAPRSGAGPRHPRHAWKAEGYYATPDGALRGLWRAEARTISADDVPALAQAYRDAADRICAQLLEALPAEGAR